MNVKKFAGRIAAAAPGRTRVAWRPRRCAIDVSGFTLIELMIAVCRDRRAGRGRAAELHRPPEARERRHGQVHDAHGPDVGRGLRAAQRRRRTPRRPLATAARRTHARPGLSHRHLPQEPVDAPPRPSCSSTPTPPRGNKGELALNPALTRHVTWSRPTARTATRCRSRCRAASREPRAGTGIA